MSRKNIYNKALSRISERTIWLDWDNAFTGTKPVTKANCLSIFNLLMQRVDGTKALDRKEGKKSSSILNKRHVSHSQSSLVFGCLIIKFLSHPPALQYE